MKQSRRTFMKTAAAAGGLALSGCGEQGDPYALRKPGVPGLAGWSTHQEKWVATACDQCPAGCGIRVRVVEGRAVKIEGHPSCPINHGGIGPKGQSGLQLLYHPERIRGPLRRSGPRGRGKWDRVSWDEAIGEVAQTLKRIRINGEPRGLVVLDGDSRGMMPELWDRFLQAYGSPNHVSHRSATVGGKILAMRYMHGVSDLPAYDWFNTRYVIGFGASLFESWCQTIHFMRASSHLRRGIPGRRVKFVQVSPRFSAGAAKADEWIPIEPATYGALALGLAHLLVRDRRFDEAFVRDRTFGFEEWKDAQGRAHRGWRDVLMKDYPPQRVSRITGIDEETLERLAVELWENRPAVALADGGAAAATNGLGTAMSIHALNALLGNLERPGGMIVQRRAPLEPWPAVEPDETARKGRSQLRLDMGAPLGLGSMQEIPRTILTGRPYSPAALFLYRSNPVFSKPGRRWIEALQKVPLVVSFSPLPDESTTWADYVLPDSTYLERWDVVEPVPSTGFPALTLRQPVVEPLYDTLPTGEVVLRLAKAIGAPVAEAFPWENWRKLCDARLKGLGKKPAEVRKDFEANGAWTGEPLAYEKWDEAFATPSGKFEFHSGEIARTLATHPELEGRLASMGIKTRGDELCMPHWEPPAFEGDAAAYPYILVPFRGIGYAEGGARHLPGLRELPLAGRYAWKNWVEVNPEDLERLHASADEELWLETPAARARFVVRSNPGIRPGTIGLPLGLGPWPPDPDRGLGGYALLADVCDPLAGILALQGTRARIRKDGA